MISKLRIAWLGRAALAARGALIGAAARILAKPRQRPRADEGGASFAWHVDPEALSFSDQWDTDIGQSRIAWARATVAAREAWERAARNSRKRVALGDPPPHGGSDP